MNRRQFAHAAAGLAALATTAHAAEPAAVPFVDPAHAGHHRDPDAAARMTALAAAYGDCAAAAQACASHCQRRLATGDKTLGDCLKAVLDTDAVATAVARLARYESAWAPVMARSALAVLDVCLEACKPHVGHHAECKACADACQQAIDKTRGA